MLKASAVSMPNLTVSPVNEEFTALISSYLAARIYRFLLGIVNRSHATIVGTPGGFIQLTAGLRGLLTSRLSCIYWKERRAEISSRTLALSSARIRVEGKYAHRSHERIRSDLKSIAPAAEASQFCSMSWGGPLLHSNGADRESDGEIV